MAEVMERSDVQPAPAPAPRCACGSGLSAARCCQTPRARLRPYPAEGRFALELSAVTRAYREGDHAQARSLAIEVLEEEPGQKEALGALFNILQVEGRLGAAARILDRMAWVNVDDLETRLLAARFFLDHGEAARALDHARMFVRLAPRQPRAHHVAGQAFLLLGQFGAADHHFRLAMAFDAEAPVPGLDAELRMLRAQALEGLGQPDAARELIAAAAAAPDAPAALLVVLARVEESAGDAAAAAALLDRALARAPQDDRARMARARVLRLSGDLPGALAALESLVESAAAPEAADEALLLKGQLLDAMGRHGEAFAAVAESKARLRAHSGRGYDAEQAAAQVGALRAYFTESQRRLLTPAPRRSDTPQPIFIIGFPRSGTTLVEQMLAAHPGIAAGDELPLIGEIAARMPRLTGSPFPYPMALSDLAMGDNAGMTAAMRDLYLERAAALGASDPAKPWFTDKMPLNETHLGLIHLLFPESPVLHVIRHPLDVVLSSFFTYLDHGFRCAYALESAAEHYARIADLIAHYQAVLPLNYHALRYESLVVDPAAALREALARFDLPFDPAMLEFHASGRVARSASQAQVRAPLHTRSVGRFRHYGAQLAPVLPLLDPAIERLGYATVRA